MSNKITFSLFALLVFAVGFGSVIAQPNDQVGTFGFECPDGQYLKSYSLKDGKVCVPLPTQASSLPTCATGQSLEVSSTGNWQCVQRLQQAQGQTAVPNCGVNTYLAAASGQLVCRSLPTCTGNQYVTSQSGTLTCVGLTDAGGFSIEEIYSDQTANLGGDTRNLTTGKKFSDYTYIRLYFRGGFFDAGGSIYETQIKSIDVKVSDFTTGRHHGVSGGEYGFFSVKYLSDTTFQFRNVGISGCGGLTGATAESSAPCGLLRIEGY